MPDTDPTNDSFTDTDTLTPEADLSVTKDDGVTSVVPGAVDTYLITVTNNGPSTVSSVTLTDTITPALLGASFTPSAGTYDQTSGVWSGLSLASGQSVTMTLTGTIDPTATGTLTNTVTVAPPAGTTDPIPGNDIASDTDTLTPAAPSIQVVKFVQSQDADIPTGPHVVVGGTVVFGYRVTNTGNVPLANVVVTDDKLGTIAGPAAGDTNGDNLLDLTETWIYGATTTAVAGQQTNLGTVTALDPITSATVSDFNPANYFGDAPRIQIVKLVNGQDADDMTTAPHVAAGSTVTFTYVVTDTGNVPLANVVVTDDKLGPITTFTGDINGNGLLDLTETWTYTQTATAVAGQQTNTGTVTAVDANNPPGTPVTDDNPANYFGDAPVDLAVTKDDGVTSAVPGASTTYLITVSNIGPSTVGSVTLTDATPLFLLNPAFGLPSAGSYDPVSGEWSGLSLASGGSVSITLTGTIDPNATGSLTNTAMVAAPAGTIDPDPANNSATDVDSLTPQGDLAITKTDGATSVVPGTSPTYTIVVSNTGPSAVIGATVSDPLPSGTTAANWTFTGSTGGGSVSGPASGSGTLATTVNLPVDATVTFTFTPTIGPGVTGSFMNTATVSPPAGVTDLNPINNSVTDTDTLTPEADLSITKTDGVPTVAPGGGTTYNIVVTNTGPSTAVDATVTDLFPGAITAVSWTAVTSPGSSVAQANGTGNITTAVTLLPGGTATFTAVAQISPAAIGSLTNTASVSPPAGGTDPDLANNTATDTDTLPGTADLAITKTDGVTTVLPGAVDTYTITVSNNGPDTVSSVTLIDAIPAALLNPVFGPPRRGAMTRAAGSGAG